MVSSIAIDTHPAPVQRSRAVAVRVDGQHLWIETIDGRMLGVPWTLVPGLVDASDEARAKVCIDGGGYVLVWDELDEAVPVPALFGLPF